VTASIHLTVQDLFTLSNQGQHPRVIVTEPDASVVRGTFVMVSPEPSLTAKALVQLDGQPEGTYNNYQASWIQIDEEGAPTL
jgi:hypothetical protein